MTTAEQERSAVLERVAGAIWAAAWPPGEMPMSWAHATIAAQGRHEVQMADMVRSTRDGARAAVAALMIGDNSRPGDVRMAHAGEHVSGLDPRVCAETFDAMLTEVLS